MEENNKLEIPEITQKSVFLGIFYRNKTAQFGIAEKKDIIC